MGWFSDCFEDLPDPRAGNARRHDLLELITITLDATLSWADSCVDFELFARSKEPFLREFLALEGCIPSHDSFPRLFRLIEPEAFAAPYGELKQELIALLKACCVFRRMANSLSSFDRIHSRVPLGRGRRCSRSKR